MAEHSAQDRTEQATPKRREESRKKGQVPRSRELSTLISLLAAGSGLLALGAGMTQELRLLFAGALSFGAEAAHSETVIATRLLQITRDGVLLLVPFLAVLLAAALAAPLLLGGWVMNFGLLAPKLERISPMKGLARIFSQKGLMELVKAIGKFALVAICATAILLAVMDRLFLLPLAPLEQALGGTGQLFVRCFLGFSAALVLIAALDVPFQLWEHAKQLKMSKQEVKDEMKETEGKPEVKGAIRERQQQIAQRRMMQEVPNADVVITNPTHYAVALRYDSAAGGAPRVVAKGKDLIAARIREIATEHGVLIFPAPPLARALYASTELGQEIPAKLFVAVAQVLAYIYQLRRAGSGPKPVPPRQLPVPDEFRTQGNA